MTRTLVLLPTDNKKFILLYNAFSRGGDQAYRHQNGQRPQEIRRSERAVFRALHSVSVVVDEAAQARKLAPEGGTLSLTQADFLLLEKYLADAPLPTELSLDLADLIDWVSAAEKVETPVG